MTRWGLAPGVLSTDTGRAWICIGLLIWTPLGCSHDSGTNPDPDPEPINLLVRPVSGDRQVALVGMELPDSLVVEVLDLDQRVPIAGMEVRWEMVRGAGGALEEVLTITDAQGRAWNRAVLGSGAERYVFRATAGVEDERWFDFEARGLEAMILDGLSAASVVPGVTLELSGSGFLPAPDSNVVLFSGIRGRVITATEDRITVQVPPCLPERMVEVSVGLGAVRSGSRDLEIRDANPPIVLEPGQDITLAGSAAANCVRFGEEGTYLAVVHSPVSMAERSFPFRLVGRRGDLVDPEGSPNLSSESVREMPPGRHAALNRTTEGGEGWIRQLERDLLEGPPPGGIPLAGGAAMADAPVPGTRRAFNVLNAEGGFDPVTATVRWVGENVAIYVDEETPEPGLDEAVLAELGARFDDPIFTLLSDRFGNPSDLDGNNRVLVLFTPRVNHLSAPGGGPVVGGFFFAGDLLGGQEGSNQAEVFYSLVPDPEGAEGPEISVEALKRGIPAVLAHELQHMIHFNRRVLEAGAASGETLWLSEGLAHLAEHLVADELGGRGLDEEAALFLRANLLRGQEYLASPQTSSALQDTGSGSLAERGGAWLFARYLEERFRADGILDRLTGTTLSGEVNVQNATGVPFAEVFSDWGAATFTDGMGSVWNENLHYPFTDLRTMFAAVPGGFMLRPGDLGSEEWDESGTVFGGGSAYFLFRVSGANVQGTAVNLARGDGGPTDPAGQLSIRVVRTF